MTCEDRVKQLTGLLADMVRQNCDEHKPGEYNSGFISTHAEAISVLGDLNVMYITADNGGRMVYGRFK